MTKFKFQIKSKVQILKCFILAFDIDLTFACPREAASAKAGILKFEIWDSTSRVLLLFFLHPGRKEEIRTYRLQRS
jgi:hypothetical protein